MNLFRKVCPSCGKPGLVLTQACLHRRTVNLVCDTCNGKSTSEIPTAGWWLHRLVLGFVAALLAPVLILFFFGQWLVWGFALLLLFGLDAAGILALHLLNCRRMLQKHPEYIQKVSR